MLLNTSFELISNWYTALCSWCQDNTGTECGNYETSNMSTNPKKGKSAKDSDKKSARKTEESTPVQERDDESLLEHEEELRIITAQKEDQPDEEKPEKQPAPHEPTPELSYEEPILTQLIVER